MADLTVLLQALKAASKRLPVLRYAWGLVGVSVAAAVIIRVHGEPKAAIIATGLAVVGFVLLVLVSLST